MIRNTLLAAMAVAAFACSTPAMAQTFTGPRVGAVVGVLDDDIFGTSTKTYGANVGYDIDVGGAVVGVTGEWQDSNDTGRELAAIARVGAKVGDSALVYALGGYSNLGVGSGTGVELDGYRLGAGVEIALGKNAYVNLEQRYSNYEFGVDGYQTALGVGFRF